MKQMYKKSSAWMILVGLFLQISTSVAAAMRSSNSSLPNMVIPGTVGVPVKMRSSELESSVDVANFNVQGLIEHVVEDAVEQGCENALSSALLRCYKSVSEGETVIDVDTLIEAMPELLEYAVTQEKMRAVRPDAPLATANNAIVACGGDCDLTQLIRLLASIRARIGTVNDNPCCGTILGILGDACNVPCIGEDGSISEVLCEILNCCTTTAAEIKGIFTVLVDIKDTLTECCAEIRSETFDTQTLIIDGFEGTWTILAGLNLNCSTTVEIDLNGVFTALANLDLNCSTTVEIDLNGVFTALADIKLEIFNTQTLIVEGFEGTWTMIDDCCACGPIPLFQSDVIGGVINLTTTGLNYCLAENITGNIFISAGNVTVDGNDRVITGRIFIDAADVIFKNAKVKPTAPGNSTEAGFAGIHATSISLKVQILNCLVECANTTVVANPAVKGRTGIFSDADKTVIKDCNVVAGNGGAAAGLAAGAVGGNGIEINGNNGLIDNSIVTSGMGGNNSAFGGVGGTGGNGIEINGNNGSINNSTVTAGNGAGIITSVGAGSGGNGIEINGNNGSINNSTVTAGNGGGILGTGGTGGNGIEINGDNGSVDNSTVTAGSGGLSFLTTGGTGGSGIEIVNGVNAAIIKGCYIISGGNGGNSNNGSGGNGGIGIAVRSGSQNIQICDCKIDNVGIAGTGPAAGTGGNAIQIDVGAQCVQVINDQILSSGGSGCSVNNATDIQIEGCSATCNGLDGFVITGTCFILADLTAFKNAGTGINVVDVTDFQVKNCKSECNGADGIAVGAPSLNGQVLSNCANSNGAVGFFNNPILTEIIYGNNASTHNGTNYGGANSPGNVAISGAAGYWDNVRP